MQYISHDSERGSHRATTGGEHPQRVAHGGKHGGFVNGDPCVNAVGKRFKHMLAKANKIREVRSLGKAPFGFPPLRMSEVVKGHDGANTSPDQVVHHGRIHGERLIVPRPFGGLNSAPLNGKSVGIEAKVTDELEILLPPIPVIARCATSFEALPFFVLGPIVDEVAFHLMRCGGGTPSNVGRESQGLEVNQAPSFCTDSPLDY